MKYSATLIKDSCYWEPDKLEDARGFFFRGFCKSELRTQRIMLDEIVQVNHSFSSRKGTFRGFHYQLPPYAEEKIVSCLEGEVLDFILDLRNESPTFLAYDSVVLSGKNHRSVLVPKGCAHGFITLTENCRLLYLHTAVYNPVYERGVSVYDPKINIDLPLQIEEISERDKNHSFLTEAFEGIIL